MGQRRHGHQGTLIALVMLQDSKSAVTILTRDDLCNTFATPRVFTKNEFIGGFMSKVWESAVICVRAPASAVHTEFASSILAAMLGLAGVCVSCMLTPHVITGRWLEIARHCLRCFGRGRRHHRRHIPDGQEWCAYCLKCSQSSHRRRLKQSGLGYRV